VRRSSQCAFLLCQVKMKNQFMVLRIGALLFPLFWHGLGGSALLFLALEVVLIHKRTHVTAPHASPLPRFIALALCVLNHPPTTNHPHPHYPGTRTTMLRLGSRGLGRYKLLQSLALRYAPSSSSSS